MFLFKKLVAPFLMPVPFFLALLLAGLALLFFTRRQKAGRRLANSPYAQRSRIRAPPGALA